MTKQESSDISYNEILQQIELARKEQQKLYKRAETIELAGKRGGYCAACGVSYDDKGDPINNRHCDRE